MDGNRGERYPREEGQSGLGFLEHTLSFFRGFASLWNNDRC